MISQTTVRFAFPATHLVAGDPRCPPRFHGHDWRVGIVFQMPPGDRSGYPDLPYREIRATCDELRNESLNDLVRGVFPTPEGLAGWFLEHFRMETGLIAVSVKMDDHEVVLMA